MRFRLLALTPVLLLGCQPESGAVNDRESCETIDFARFETEQLNPVSLLENGEFLFEGDSTVGKACVLARVCQINSYTRNRFSQSYYVRLDSVGGAEIARLFPDVTAQVREGSDSRGWHLYLNNFCSAAK